MRYNPNMNKGLTEQQVNERVSNNLVNYDTSVPTKKISQIILGNIFTLFNFLNLGLALLVFLTGSYKNLAFLGVVLCNTVISTIQEVRSKKTIDKLSIIAKSKVKVIRDSKAKLIDIDEVVLDDIMILRSGNQVTVDSIILDNEVCVDESFITGESEPITLKKGDMLKSGSFIVVGSCKAKVEHIGIDNYTSLISKDAKYVKKINSILMKSLNQIIKVVSIAIVPVGILLYINQYRLPGATFSTATINTVAALIGMIPEGLVLLTSTVLAVGVIRLAKLNVLVQELYCIEMLAHVDTICLDKTGTITDGNMKVKEVITLDEKYDLNLILGNMVNHLTSDNATMEALKSYFKKQDNFELLNVVPFSPVYKYSGVSFNSVGTFVIGAPEFIYDKEIKKVTEVAKENRALLICHSKNKFNDKKLPSDLKPIGIISLEDTIRPNAINTLNYFKEQNVDIKIISGDSVLTVTAIGSRIGLNNLKAIDVGNLSDEQLKNVVNEYNVFGRVKPVQKKMLVKYLQEAGHVVAMTGDGVNDVLALKEADCSIALASGSDASRNVSQLVLLDSDFDALPAVVKEGRKTINNIERSASLFITKTIYAFLIAILFVFVDWSYPFEPVQLTLTSMFTIGIPSFILALEPNKENITGNFLIKVFTRSVPAALTIVLNIILISLIGHFINVDNHQITTLSVIMTGFTGFLLLIKICMPFNKVRITLLFAVITGFILGVVGFKEFFSLTLLKPYMLILMTILVITSTIIFNIITTIVNHFVKKKPELFKGGEI